MPYFIDRVDSGQVQVFSHDGKILQFGRGTNVEVRLDDPAVDLVHAAVEQQSGDYVVVDKGSTLGTLVNRERVERHVLKTGDTIGIGTFEITVEVLPGARPLFLHVARIGEADANTAGMTIVTRASSKDATVETFAGTFAARTAMRTAILRTATMRTTGANSLVAMAEAYAEAQGLPMVDSEGSGVSDIRDAMPAVPPPPPVAPPPQAPPLAPVDYAGAYRLERGAIVRKSTVALLLILLAISGVVGLVALGAQDVFSPGAISPAHVSVTANHCDACHRPFQGVGEEGCLTSGCHAKIGSHQTSMLRDPSCLECHVEHSTLDALTQLDPEGGCVSCHQRLDAETLGKPAFVATITDFNLAQHPPFTPRTDPGNLKFNHTWHLNKLARVPGQTAPTCADCHRRTVEGEIEPVSFEKHCQRCHNLAFDARYGSREAEHGTPEDMLNDMTGFYLQNRGVLRRLTAEEEYRLRGRSLNEEEQLAVVAEWNALSVVRNKCRICHAFDGRPGDGPLRTLNVAPTQIRVGWYDHATFKHGPHLALPEIGDEENGCERCHPTARTSAAASDVLLAQIESCVGCHRPPLSTDTGTNPLGRTLCIACHTYHPEPGEGAADVAP